MSLALHADLRFRAAPLDLRGIYRLLLDYQDAAGDIAARGLDGIGAVAAALGCAVNEARSLMMRMEPTGLVRVEAARVCLLVGSARGREGGMSPAERKRRSRAGGHENVTARHRQVTGQPIETTNETGNGHGLVTAPLSRSVTGDISPISAPSLSPLTLSSLSSPTSSLSAPAGGVASTLSVPTTDALPAKQGGLFGEETVALTAPKKPRARSADAPEPLPFKLGEALDALVSAAAGRVVRGEGRDITRPIAIALNAQIRAYPTLAEWSLVGAWLADGALAHRGTLGPSWVASAAFREAMALARDWAAKNRPAANTPAQRVDGRHRPQPATDPRRGIQPPAPASAYDHKRLAHLLGVKWPGWSPGIETLAQAFQRICGVSLDEARQRFPLDPTASTAPRTP